MSSLHQFQELVKEFLPLNLPESRIPDPQLPHAPKRNIDGLSKDDKHLAVRNALRYFPSKWHHILIDEFAHELKQYGRIYMYRFLPDYEMRARPIEQYPCVCKPAAAIMLMIQNNLDPLVAKYPQELITYGGNGAVFQNWAQYRLCMNYLSRMSLKQTLVLYSGHSLGLFPSTSFAPRVVVTNGMMIPNYSTKEDWNKFNALGVTQYGQMTAGSFMYIGPQGIVHGTTITLLNAGRMNFGSSDLRGKLFITSGLGGMSGAQSLAAVITGATCIIAEVDPDAIHQRIQDNYIDAAHVYHELPVIFEKAQTYIGDQGICLVYAGNVVDLWEYAARHKISVHLGSDQTSLHNIDDLGYCPGGLSFVEAKELLASDKNKFMAEVRQTLRRHVDAVNILHQRGMYFWDYGNAFLKEAALSDADIIDDSRPSGFRYPSYVEDIMGPLCFDYGFGPFRWVCTSGSLEDLRLSDQIAAETLMHLEQNSDGNRRQQYQDNIRWIKSAGEQLPVVGSKSRILYADAEGRIQISLAFNEAIGQGKIGPVVLGRDHHDVSGTDSPFRETSNIYDGSRFTADMAVHNVIGDAFRGASWVSLHNGGGVGWGDVINGGFGMLIDGTEESKVRIEQMLFWDVNNGIARRAWARNPGAIQTIQLAMDNFPDLEVTLPNIVENELTKNIF